MEMFNLEIDLYNLLAIDYLEDCLGVVKPTQEQISFYENYLRNGEIKFLSIDKKYVRSGDRQLI